MSATLRKMYAGYVSYLEDAVSDVMLSKPNSTMTASAYYTQEGNPAGVFIGRGLNMINRVQGQTATREDAQRLLDKLYHPDTDKPLKAGQKLHEANPVSVNKKDQASVTGYDMTFQCPKSVSVLWALADPKLAKQIERIHHEAIQDTISLLEENYTYTRRGKGGVLRERVNGLSAIMYDHYTNRDNEPHLHSHVALSNYVTCEDGTIRALDGTILFNNIVAFSNHHNAILMDKLRKELGVEFHYHNAITGNGMVWDINGMSDDFLKEFTARGAESSKLYNQYVEKYVKENGIEPDKKIRATLKKNAWHNTRKPKPKDPEPIQYQKREWRQQARKAGYDIQQIIQNCLHKNQTPFFTSNVLNSSKISELLSEVTVQDLAHNSGRYDKKFTIQNTDDAINYIAYKAQDHQTSITRGHIWSTVSEMTASIPMIDSKTRDNFNQKIVKQVVDTLIPITTQKYALPESLQNTPIAYADQNVFGADKSAGNELYVTKELWDAEEKFIQISEQTLNDNLAKAQPDEILSMLTQYDKTAKHRLSTDQFNASKELLLSKHRISALVGAAGTGKTTTLKTVFNVLDKTVAADRILGISPSARGATELEASLEKPCNTIAAIINEAEHHYNEKTIENATKILNNSTSNSNTRAKAKSDLAVALANRERLKIPQNGVIIIDEASMANTIDMSKLAKLCEQYNSRMIMVGDPHQLDSVGVGQGSFNHVVDANKAVAKLEKVWRFYDEHEAKVSVDFAKGKMNKTRSYYTAIKEYRSMKRIHGGTLEDVRFKAYNATLQDIQNGIDSVLIVATNDTLSDLNKLFSDERQKQGLVEKDPLKRLVFNDGNTYGKGDIICTRTVDRKKVASDGTFVKNGDLWQIQNIDTQKNSMLLRNQQTRATITLPNEWVTQNAEGGYACTVHRSQGITVTNARVVIAEDSNLTRNLAYVAATRGRASNEFYVEVQDPQEITSGHEQQSTSALQWRNYLEKKLQEQGKHLWKSSKVKPEDASMFYTYEDLIPSMDDLAEAALQKICDNNTRGVLAHTQKQVSAKKAYSISTLLAEKTAIIDYATSNVLNKIVENKHGKEYLQKLTASEDYSKLVKTFTKAYTVDSERALNILETYPQNFKNNSNNVINDSEIVSNLNNKLADLAVVNALEQDSSSKSINSVVDALTDKELREGIRNVLEQNSQMIQNQVKAIIEDTNSSAWINNIITQQQRSDISKITPQQQQLIQDTITYRAQYNIKDNYSPLGKLETHNMSKTQLQDAQTLQSKILLEQEHFKLPQTLKPQPRVTASTFKRFEKVNANSVQTLKKHSDYAIILCQKLEEAQQINKTLIKNKQPYVAVCVNDTIKQHNRIMNNALKNIQNYYSLSKPRQIYVWQGNSASKNFTQIVEHELSDAQKYAAKTIRNINVKNVDDTNIRKYSKNLWEQNIEKAFTPNQKLTANEATELNIKLNKTIIQHMPVEQRFEAQKQIVEHLKKACPEVSYENYGIRVKHSELQYDLQQNNKRFNSIQQAAPSISI